MRRASTRESSPSGRSSASGPRSSSSGRSSSASTYASAAAGPIAAASPRAPSRSPIAFDRIVFPAPVSPVIAFSAGSSSRSASRMRTRFSMRSRRSTRPWYGGDPPVPSSVSDGAESVAVAAEERPLRERPEQAPLLAEPHRDAVAGGEVAEGVAVDEHARREVGRPVVDDEVAAATDDERAGMERVRRDERRHHRVEPPDEDGAAVREVVGGGAGRSRADQAVARLYSESLAADRVAELDHPPERGAGDDGVVDGDAALRVQLHVERRELDHLVVAGERPPHAGLELVVPDRRQEPDAPEVDAEDGDAGAEEGRERAQHRAVAAEDDREVRAGRPPGCVAVADELDAGVGRDRLQPLERPRHALGAAVREDGSALNRRRRRSTSRSRPGGGLLRRGRGGGRTHGCPSGRGDPSLRARPVAPATRERLRRPPAEPAAARPPRGRRLSAPRRAPPRTAA